MWEGATGGVESGARRQECRRHLKAGAGITRCRLRTGRFFFGLQLRAMMYRIARARPPRSHRCASGNPHVTGASGALPGRNPPVEPELLLPKPSRSENYRAGLFHRNPIFRGRTAFRSTTQEDSMKYAMKYAVKGFTVFGAAVLLALFATTGVHAQANQTVIPGTQVRVTLANGLSTSVAHDGDPFTAVVAEPPRCTARSAACSARSGYRCSAAALP
jgi:hypothetical protein